MQPQQANTTAIPLQVMGNHTAVTVGAAGGHLQVRILLHMSLSARMVDIFYTADYRMVLSLTPTSL